MGKRTWTREEIDILINDYKNDVLVRDISKKLNKSIGSVKSKIISLELPRLYIKKIMQILKPFIKITIGVMKDILIEI